MVYGKQGIVERLIARKKGSRVYDIKDEGIELGVDSGQMSISDLSKYKSEVPKDWDYGLPTDNDRDVNDWYKREGWYGMVCSLTLRGIGEPDEKGRRSYQKAGIFPGGVVSSSGYGDGVYPLTLELNENSKVIGVIIDFTEEDEEDEENM